MAPALPHVAGIDHEDLVVRGIRRHLATAGPADGPVVLLHHGWPQHWYQWRHLIPALADAGYRVIAPDSRGFGWSEHPPDEDFSHAAFVDDVVALCGTLGLEQINYVGHDWGCWFGFLLALQRPDLVERAALISAPHPWLPPPALDLDTMLRFSKLSYQVAIASPTPPGPLKPALFRLIAQAAHGDRFSESELDTYMRPLSQPAQQRASTQLYRNTVLREAPAIARGGHAGERLTMPVLYMIGDGDQLFDEELVNELPSHGDDVQVEIVRGAGHFVPEETPDVVRDRVLAFLA